jgi:sec-independent protein translocase protein TatA
MNLGPAEILVILVIALLVFGPARLPEIGRQVGRGVRELRKFQDIVKRDLDEVLADDTTEAPKGDPPPTLPPKAIEAPSEPSAAPPPASTPPPSPPSPSGETS